MVDGCDRKHHAKGYCRPHGHRIAHHGTTERLIIRQQHCDVEGCERRHYSLGLCETHYQRQRGYGRTDLLTQEDRFWARVVEHENGNCWMWTGGKRKSGHGSYDNSSAYRFSYKQMVGEIPEGLELDHLCNIPECVNPYHLDPVTPAENKRRAAAHRSGGRA